MAAVGQVSGFADYAFQWSRSQPVGSARMLALGGAQNALGGDLGAMATNPAGLGLYRYSAVEGSLGGNIYASWSRYFGNRSRELKGNAHIGNLGLTISTVKDPIVEDQWRGGNLSLSINRLADYHSKYSYQNPRALYSLIDQVQASARDFSLNNLTALEGAFFDTFLIDRLVSRGPPVLGPGGDTVEIYLPLDLIHTMDVKETVEVSGSQYQFDVGWGGNYDDRIYFGAALGVNWLNHTEEVTYREEVVQSFPDFDPEQTALDRWRLREKFEINGRGFNFKLGGIYRFHPKFRLGLAYQTPTLMSLEQNEEFTVRAEYGGFRYQTASTSQTLGTESVSQEFDALEFSYVKPGKLRAGLAFFPGKWGFLSYDIEWVNYGGIRLWDDEDFLEPSNNLADNNFNAVLEHRAGLELRYKPYRLRLGGGFSPNPFDESLQERRQQWHLSGGLGYQHPDYYFDLAYIYRKNTRERRPFGPVGGIDPGAAAVWNRSHKLVFSAGTYF